VLTGQVVNTRTGEPVRKASVTLSLDGAGPGSASVTDAEGRFGFHVKAGRYRLAVQRDGFVRTDPADPRATGLTLSAGQTLDLKVDLVPLCVIAGRVLDADGDPLQGALVSAIRVSFSNGKRGIERASRVTSNDLGEYRFFDLLPGTYYVAASSPDRLARRTRSQGDASVLTYYPSAADMGGATPLDLGPGTTLAGIDVVTTRTPRVSVSGTVLNPPAGGSVMVSLMPPDSTMAVKFLRKDAKYQPETGTFSLHGVSPGAYLLLASASSGESVLSSREEIVVGRGPLRGVGIYLSPAVDVEGEVRVEPHGSFETTGLNVALRAPGPGRGVGRVDKTGSFTIHNVIPNDYTLTVTGLPPSGYLKSVSLRGVTQAPSKLDLNGEGSPGLLSIVVSAEGGRVVGTVREAERPADGALVALVPSQRERGDLYKSAQATVGGAFALDGVAPGEYALFAWQGVDPSAFQNPALLTRFEDRGQAVTVRENATLTVQLRMIPESDLN
jgi:hypothetical protein